MTIEIRNPELQAILQSRMKAGNFASAEDLLLETFRDSPEASEEGRRARALEAAARIR